jgi:hypothetical protein
MTVEKRQTMKNNSTKATTAKTSAKKTAKVKKVERNYRKVIDNAQTLKLIAQAKKQGVNVTAVTSIVRFIRSKGFGASNQVIADIVNSKRAYA